MVHQGRKMHKAKLNRAVSNIEINNFIRSQFCGQSLAFGEMHGPFDPRIIGFFFFHQPEGMVFTGHPVIH